MLCVLASGAPSTTSHQQQLPCPCTYIECAQTPHARPMNTFGTLPPPTSTSNPSSAPNTTRLPHDHIVTSCPHYRTTCSYIKRLKMEILAAIASTTNVYDIVGELTEYARDVVAPSMAREAVGALAGH